MSLEPSLNVTDLTVRYDTRYGGVTALENATLRIPIQGYTLGIVGESGSGKSTLGMALLNAIEPPGRIARGRIEYNGTDVLAMNKSKLSKYRWQEVSMVYQGAMNSLNPVKKVSDPIAEVLALHSGLSRQKANEESSQILSKFGLDDDMTSKYPHELSGGQKQRVVIALALALSPKILVADEPTSALDVVTQMQILQILKAESRKNKNSLIFITHDIALLGGLVENIAVMYSGGFVEIGPAKKVLFEPLHPYTEMLISKVLMLESGKYSTTVSAAPESSKPSPVPNSCRYSNACKYTFDRCRKEKPELIEVEKGRLVACHKYP
jgi:oligopeptide/dipeptide ABC transporter ATP-binding protein